MMGVKNKTILYIGNNLGKSTKYTTTLDTLSDLLTIEGYDIIKSSDNPNKVLRLLEMCIAVIKNRNKVGYMLIDTFSTSNFYYAFLTSQLARIFKLKYVPILHGGNLPSRLDGSKKLAAMVFNNSYRNVAPSNYLKSAFEQRGYRTLFIPNILEIEKYTFKKRISLSSSLLWVRAFKDLYNPKMAIEVLQIVMKTYPYAKLCMVGPIVDRSYEETVRFVHTHNVDKHTEFTGVLSKEDWIKKSEDYDLFINTTNFDNTPVSVMEAMALGLTVVSTNAGGMPYLIEHDKDGILVEKGAADQMAQEIIKIIDTNRQDLAQNARKKIETFQWNTVKKQWLEILA